MKEPLKGNLCKVHSLQGEYNRPCQKANADQYGPGMHMLKASCCSQKPTWGRCCVLVVVLFMPLHGPMVAEHHFPQCLAQVSQTWNVAVWSDVLLKGYKRWDKLWTLPLQITQSFLKTMRNHSRPGVTSSSFGESKRFTIRFK